jgi:hypothetical protein
VIASSPPPPLPLDTQKSLHKQIKANDPTLFENFEDLKLIKTTTHTRSKSQPSQTLQITGDDVLIEYCQRIIFSLRLLNENAMAHKEEWAEKIMQFVSHSVWKTAVGGGGGGSVSE